MTISRFCVLLAAVMAMTTATVHADDRPTGDRWEKDIRKFESQDRATSTPQNGILFVGSSSIRIWDLKKYFPGLPAINRGFGGSQVSDVIHYFDRIVLPYHPKTIVFYSGDNDIAAKKTTATVAADVKQFISLVRTKLPDTRLIIFPPKPTVLRAKMWPAMHEVGLAEKKMAENDSHVIFLDPTPKMLDQGKPRADLLRKDGLHMNDKGYLIWSDMVRPLLKQ